MKNTGDMPFTKRPLTNDELFSDEKTDRKIHRHIADINDVITEEDIMNVKTDFNIDSADLPIADKADLNEQEAGPDTDLPPVTPWDVLK